MSKYFSKIWIIIILAILIAGSIFVWQYFGRPIEEVSTDETAGWQNYANNQYGFEIKYPVDAQIKSSEENISFIFADNQRRLDIKVITEFGFKCHSDTAWSGDSPSISLDSVVFTGVASGLKAEPYDAIQYCTIYSGIAYELIPQIIYIPETHNFVEKDAILNQMLSTFRFIGERKIQIGKINIDSNEIGELQKAVDAGQQPWRLDIIMAALADLPQYGFTQDDLKNLQCPHIASYWVVGKDITSLPCEISHDGQKYAVIVSQPQPGIGKIWMVSEIELAPFK